MNRKLIFQGDAFEDFTDWVKLDRKLYVKIVALIKDIDRSPFMGSLTDFDRNCFNFSYLEAEPPDYQELLGLEEMGDRTVTIGKHKKQRSWGIK